MIINKLILKNFRIFNGTHEFDFSNSKVIVIEGPNGHGKSTIFDAINWVLSGKIDRYTGSSEYQQFNYIINNTAYQDKDPRASVEIVLEHNEKIFTVKRQIRNSSVKLFINNLEYRLSEGQKLITKLLVKDSRGELVEGLGIRNNKVDMSAFLASTTILSQEGLENFVRSDKPTERYAVLEKVLGLTRYGEGFRDFLKKIEKENEEHREKLEVTKINLMQDKKVLDAKHEQKVKHDNRLGKVNKEDLLTEINVFISNLEKSNGKLIKLTEITEKELLLLQKIKEENSASMDQLNEINDSIKRNYLIDTNSELIESNIRNSKRKKLEMDTKKSKRIQSLSRIEYKKNELLSISRDVKRIEVIGERIQKVDFKIEEVATFKENILVELLKKYDEEELKDISDFPEKYDRWTHLLAQYKRMIELSKNHEKLKEIEREKEKVAKLLKELIGKKSVKTDELKEIDLILNKLSDKQIGKKESHVNRLVNEIQEKILSTDNLQSCMICGTYFNTENELKETVRNQLRISYEDLNELDKQIREKELIKGSVINEIEDVLKDIKKSEKKIDLLKNNINELNGKIIELLARIDLEIKEESIDSFPEKMKKLEKSIRKYEYKYNLAKELKKIQIDINDLVKEKNTFNQEKKDLMSKNNKIQRYIDNPNIIGIKLSRIDNYTYAAKINIQELEKQGRDEMVKISEERRKRDLLVEYSGKLKGILGINHIDLDGTELNNLVNRHLDNKTNNNRKLDNFHSEIASYLNATELFVLEKEISKCSQELNEIKGLIDRHSVISSQLIKFTKNHREVQSDLINGYLDELTEEINNFYQQISPHAYYDFLRLLVKENELFILLSETEFKKLDSNELNFKDTVNASLTLSAAQSTVLAMSIFLALNTSQNWSKLRILGIDDPFQNLDDINIYSFIDVISFLVKEEKKQIFISTHHPDFSKLMASKLRFKDAQFSHVSFQSYTRERMSIKSNCYKYLDE